MGNKTVSIQVFGKVQGVYYRQSTHKVATELGLQGKVLNQTDGTVFIEASGNEEAIAQLIHWCQDGPVLARVSRVEVKELPARSYKGFEIER